VHTVCRLPLGLIDFCSSFSAEDWMPEAESEQNLQNLPPELAVAPKSVSSFFVVFYKIIFFF